MPDELLKRETVQKLTGLSCTTIYDLMKEGRFPRPVMIGKVARWVSSELEAWIGELIKERNAAAPHAQNAR